MSKRRPAGAPPATIELGYQTIEVQVHVHMENLGEAETDAGIIRVKDGQNAVETANVVVHELLHTIYRQMSLEPGDEEERIVNSLANGLIDAFRRNPSLMNWFKRSLK